MREVRLGDQTLRLKATPLAMLFYRQEFEAEMSLDLLTVMACAEVADGQDVPSATLDVTDVLVVLQLAWAMAKNASHPKAFSGFESWLADVDDVDVFDGDFLGAVLEVAADGLFRRRGRNQG